MYINGIKINSYHSHVLMIVLNMIVDELYNIDVFSNFV